MTQSPTCEIRALCGRAGYFRQACRRGETRHFYTEVQAGKSILYTTDEWLGQPVTQWLQLLLTS